MAKYTDMRGTEIKQGTWVITIDTCVVGSVLQALPIDNPPYTMYSIDTHYGRDMTNSHYCLVLPTVEINGKVWCTDASLMPNDLVCLVNMVMTDKHIHTDMGFKKGKRFYGKNSGCDIKYIDTWWPVAPEMPKIGK